MKKRQSSLFKKVLLTFMVSILTLFMSGCSSSINQMSIEKVCKALEEKYGEEFEVTKLGDRINTGHTKFQMNPVNNKEIVFEATMDNDDGVVVDSYVRASVANRVEKEIKNLLEKIDIKTELIISLSCKDLREERNTKLSLWDLVKNYSCKKIFIDLPLNENDYSEEKVNEIMGLLKKFRNYYGVNINGFLYRIPNEAYDKCLGDLNTYYMVSDTWFRQYGLKEKYSFSINENNIKVRLSY